MINSNRGIITLPSLYLAWDNITSPAVTPTDCGDEMFGIALGSFYIGCYSGTGWCMGMLDENGLLN